MPGAQLHGERLDIEAGRLRVTYLVRSEAGAIEARARAIAVEQSVELPVEAIDDARIRDEIVGEVVDINERGAGVFEVAIALAQATMPPEPGQFLNMLFGNT